MWRNQKQWITNNVTVYCSLVFIVTLVCVPYGWLAPVSPSFSLSPCTQLIIWVCRRLTKAEVHDARAFSASDPFLQFFAPSCEECQFHERFLWDVYWCRACHLDSKSCYQRFQCSWQYEPCEAGHCQATLQHLQFDQIFTPSNTVFVFSTVVWKFKYHFINIAMFLNLQS